MAEPEPGHRAGEGPRRGRQGTSVGNQWGRAAGTQRPALYPECHWLLWGGETMGFHKIFHFLLNIFLQVFLIFYNKCVSPLQLGRTVIRQAVFVF